MMPSVMIAGLGYTGRRIVTQLAASDHRITTLARTPRPDLETRNIEADLDAPASLRVLADQQISHLIYLAPPAGASPASASPTSDGDSDQRLTALLDCLPALQQVCLASTTGVYGDHQGLRVDEHTPCRAQTPRARARLKLENTARSLCAARNIALCMLRIAGIYGPGRLPLEALRRGDPIIDPAEAGPGNRIHVDDLAEACITAVFAETPPDIVNVCDGHYLSSSDFTLRVAEYANLPEPPLISLDEAQRTFSPMRLSFINESRTVDNTRLLQGLGVTLRYPTAEAGIKASLRAENASN
ncbi:MAG: NAD-dependent epimerase/dehydratase family protein [Pseudomonadota bacterium]